MGESAEDATDQLDLVAAFHLLPAIQGGQDALQARLTYQPDHVTLCGSKVGSMDQQTDKLFVNERGLWLQG